MADANASEREKSLAGEILERRNNARIDPEPILVSAGLTKSEGRYEYALIVGASDEDGDLASVGVREHHLDPSGASVIIEEEYPVFAFQHEKAAVYYVVPVGIRNENTRKSEEDWKEYLAGGVWDNDRMPTLWISVPDPGKVNVEIWISDRTGHKTDVVTVDNCIPSGEKGTRNEKSRTEEES